MNKPILKPEDLELAKQVEYIAINNKTFTSSEKMLIINLTQKVKHAFECAEMFNDWEKGIE